MSGGLNRKALRKIDEAKKRSRPELNHSWQWDKMNYAEVFHRFTEVNDNVERINVDKVSIEDFIEKYEKPFKPVVITGTQKNWPALHRWTLDKLRLEYKNEKFTCGEDDYGQAVKLKLKYFIDYMSTNNDDSPLYIFDSDFGKNQKRRKLLKDYTCPKYFKEDLFRFSGERRPLKQWFVMGPARSGSGIHIDPLCTSAWNALVQGHKRWCLFPNHTPKELLKVNPTEGGRQCYEAITWFSIIYPRTQLPNWPQDCKPLEIIQSPGETVFVPSGWWHVVLNLDTTIAVTENFCSRTIFPIVWQKALGSNKKLAKEWYAILKEKEPELVASVIENRYFLNFTGIESDSSSSNSYSSTSSTS